MSEKKERGRMEKRERREKKEKDKEKDKGRKRGERAMLSGVISCL